MTSRAVSARTDAAPNPSRSERRDEKRRTHEARKKAKAIEKENDKQAKARDKSDKSDKKNNKNQKKQDKKRR